MCVLPGKNVVKSSNQRVFAVETGLETGWVSKRFDIRQA
jgi:hypothetical protein